MALLSHSLFCSPFSSAHCCFILIEAFIKEISFPSVASPLLALFGSEWEGENHFLGQAQRPLKVSATSPF